MQPEQSQDSIRAFFKQRNQNNNISQPNQAVSINIENRRNGMKSNLNNFEINQYIQQSEESDQYTSSSSMSSKSIDSEDQQYLEEVDEKKEEINKLMLYIKISEQIEDYDIMCEYVRSLVNISERIKYYYFDQNQRNWAQSAFHMAANKRRVAIRAIHQYEHMQERQKDIKAQKTIQWYREQIENELKEICLEAIQMTDSQLKTINLIKMNKDQFDVEAYLFFNKMKGDFYRYYGEVLEDIDLKENTYKAEQAYQEAWKFVSDKNNLNDQIKQMGQNINKSDVIRISIGLNYSVFLYEMQNNLQKAYDIASKTFEMTVQDREILDFEEEYYKDCIAPIQILRENIQMWEAQLEIINQEKQNNEIQ
ncbi:14-3-3 domain [Pseudocohnilembus persalinus]|uniref:14-3-3 domain n=1 Tax=Pseudocohnilembus persalinus TaxID=266149 RepID=A0A0V0QJA5_PSEPJ|nr:14-3-3 domain [Pseudocohnilembus persalinus]|eukprot:KRX02337.1 14-3-3 domain [Pseudocohnilembus persalinus]